MPRLIFRLQLSDSDVAAVRTLTREVADLARLDGMQQTRLTTAVSEIVRNAKEHAQGGTVDFLVGPAPGALSGQCLVIEVLDRGPGIADVAAALEGRVLPNGRTGMGIPGSRRLVDRLAITLPPGGGTAVRLEMDLPRHAADLTEQDLDALAAEMRRRRPLPAHLEVEQQNRELLRVQQQLRDNQLALERADERKNQFVKTLVHELRTPLSTLDMTLALLKRKPDLGPVALLERCEVMGRQTAQLTRLVDELMDVARVSQGKVTLDRRPSELNALTAQAVEMTGGAIAAKSHDLTLRLHAEPLWVSADASRLTQVLCNLIQNSARYTPDRGRIEVQLHRNDRKAVVQVVDNGIGIASDLLPYVFDLFVQGDDKPAGAEGGLGIGLTLVQHLVAGHGGEVKVASPGADQGSTFTVSLPLIDQPVAA